MNEITNTEAILEKASACFKGVRQNLLVGASLLYQISSERLYEPQYASFNAFLEQECQIGASFASKLISVFKTYVIDGGIEQKKLEGVDYEKLYLAIRIQGSLSDKLTKASVLTRSEIKQELAEKDGHDCAHDCEHVTICTRCHARV